MSRANTLQEAIVVAKAVRQEEPVLRLEGLSRSFGAMTVLSGVDLSVERGEVLGIMGPNGAGKSTLFNLVCGVLAPSAGRVLIQGRDVGRDPPWKRAANGLGRTYQIPKPFMRTTVYENVLISACCGSRGLKRASETALAVLETTGLAARSGQLAADLSLLDLKRLELAKAIALGPDLLLLDEIAGGLTDLECEILVKMLNDIRARGVTIVWIEHVLHVLKRIATRLAVLNGGRILTIGSPASVLADARVKEVYLGV